MQNYHVDKMEFIRMWKILKLNLNNIDAVIVGV